MGNRKAAVMTPCRSLTPHRLMHLEKLNMPSILCSDGNYNVQRDETWKASSRGVYLVTRITATVERPSGNIQAGYYQG